MLKGQRLHRREGLLLELVDEDGTTGLGEASPLPGFSQENLEETASQLGDLASSMLGLEITEDCTNLEGAFVRDLDSMELAPSVRFGFELAAWNTYAKAKGESIPEILSSSPAASVPVNALISGSSEETLLEARRVRGSGYEAVKLKVGGQTVEEDVEFVRAVGDVLGDVVLRLDANRAWSFEEAVRFARATADVGYEYIEEPLTDPSKLPELASEYGMPVALDESLVGLRPVELEEHSYARAFVLKPTLLGGLSRALRISGIALDLGVTPVVSSTYETGVGMRALISLAAGIGRNIPAGLDTYRRLGADILEPSLEVGVPRLDVYRIAGANPELRREHLTVLDSSGS